MDIDKKALGQRLRKSIDAAGYKGRHNQFAQELGFAATTLSNWLTGTATISLEHLVPIAAKVGQSLDYLVFGSDGIEYQQKIEHEPMVGYLSKALDDLQKHHQNSSRMYTNIALALADQINMAAEKFADGYVPNRNCMDVTEAVALEQFSLETWVASKDMRYNFKAEKNAYGHFDQVNAANLRQGRSYSFLTYGSEEDRETDILEHQNVLKKQSGRSSSVLNNCHFACTLNFPFVGFAIYRLDAAALEAENKPLFARVQDVLYESRQSGRDEPIAGTYAGITMLPSPDSPVFVLMETDDVPRALNYYKQLFSQATQF